MWKYLVPAGVFVVVVVFLYMGLYRRPEVIPSPFIGKAAPAFSLPDVRDDSRRVSNTDYTGRAYVLNVWGTWCAGCREEHETLLTIARSGTVPIVGLNWNDDRALANRWLEELGNPYHAVAFDPQGQVAIDWGVYGAPETFLVSKEGRVLYKHIGPLTGSLWRAEFLPRINASQSQPVGSQQ